MSIQKNPFQLSDNWIKLLSEHADSNGLISYEMFSELALFHSEFGYYTSKRKRVGKDKNSDFYTSTTHCEVFPELISESICTLLDKHCLTADSFIEIGAEPEQNQWKDHALPCPSKIFRFGESFQMDPRSVVYSNELFDAQPFQRWVAIKEKWIPIRLKLDGCHLFETIESRDLSVSEQAVFETLPQAPVFEYFLDISPKAVGLLNQMILQNWKGIFVAIDYGKTWAQLTSETPQGTAKALHNHQQSSILYQSPGEQDLTTHVCWDHLIDGLEKAGFTDIQLSTQSRFLMEHASKAIESIVTAEQGLTSKRKSQLLELISPGFFGQRFQVLTAVRK